MRSKANMLSKLLQITKTPIRIFCKARDFYVKNMLDFANSGKVGCGSIGGGVANLPKSYSVNSSSTREADDVEFRQLLRLLSKKGSEMESYMQYCKQGDHRRSCSRESSAMRRSYSVGLGKIGKIDEDRACSFREDEEDANEYLYNRSRSHAIRRKVVYY